MAQSEFKHAFPDEILSFSDLTYYIPVEQNITSQNNGKTSLLVLELFTTTCLTQTGTLY